MNCCYARYARSAAINGDARGKFLKSLKLLRGTKVLLGGYGLKLLKPLRGNVSKKARTLWAVTIINSAGHKDVNIKSFCNIL